ncbi:MAG: hypothetical protein WD200_03005 [Candidatus Andersenbacteria bacterium]
MARKNSFITHDWGTIITIVVGLLLVFGAVVFYPYEGAVADNEYTQEHYVSWLTFIAGFFIVGVGGCIHALRRAGLATSKTNVDVVLLSKRASAVLGGVVVSMLVSKGLHVLLAEAGLLEERFISAFIFLGLPLLIHYVGFRFALKKKYLWFGMAFVLTYLAWLAYGFGSVIQSLS